MTGTLTTQPHLPQVRTHRDLLAAAALGEVRAISHICDRHSAALLALSRAILGDPAGAEAVVVDVLAKAFTEPGATETARSLRSELARLTYLHATRRLLDADLPPAPSGSATARMEELATVARQQRSAIALLRYGDHSLNDVADRLELPHSTIAALLRTGLQELHAAHQDAAHG